MPENHVELAHAKLTTSLRIVGRRPDGYHLLDAEFVSLDLADEIVFAPDEATTIAIDDDIAWTGAAPLGGSGAPADRSNLVVRALELAGRQARVRLKKRIPAGAGLGGGSSDAAAALRFAGVDDAGLAAKLGADVPFCVRGGRARVRGVGEVLDPLVFEERKFLVVAPGFSVSTMAVYAAYDEGRGDPDDAASGSNALEPAALRVEPRLFEVRATLSAAAGRVASLAGSGSSYFVEVNPADAAAVRVEVMRAVEEATWSALVVICATVPSL